MKRQIWQRLTRPPTLKGCDLFLTVGLAGLWYLAVLSRPALMNLQCSKDPTACTRESVFMLDRFSLGMENHDADAYSFTTQNTAGALAIALPPLWIGALAIGGRILPFTALIAVGTDFMILLQSIAWNGVITEALRLLVQRPRPFVYNDPGRLGAQPSHYTSFISGHTSFTATAGASLVFTLAGRGAPLLLTAGIATLTTALVIATGVFRILAGRHFMTDVLIGALVGLLISFTVAFFHRLRVKIKNA